MTLPKSSTPSTAKYMSSLQFSDTTEKALMVRIGTLVDAIIAAQRGNNNAGATLNRQVVGADNRNTPPSPTGTAQNIFNGVAVSLNPVTDPSTLSHYEVQIDSNNQFNDPTTKTAFNTDMTFKGLTAETNYNLRCRSISKDGFASDWFSLGQVTTGASPGGNTSAIDGTVAEVQRTSITFTFNNDAEDMFVSSNFGQESSDGITNSGEFYLQVFQDAALQETLTLEGYDVASDPFTYDSTAINHTRHWPLAFFTLIEPADSPSTHNFSVRTPDNHLTKDAVVYVKF